MTGLAGLDDRIIGTMKLLGFTATDAKAYIALLKEHPASGYELAARSGVPRSAIYNVLRHLQSLGLVNAVQEKPARYVPLSPDRLTELLETRFSQNLDELKGGLDRLVGPAKQAATWTVQGYPAMLEQAQTLIAGSEHDVYLSVWSREALKLVGPLKKARDRGVEVVLFSFTEIPDSYGRVLSYGLDEQDLESYWAHKIIVVSDHRRALLGGAEQSDQNRAVITEEPALVEMAISNLILDVTLFGQRTEQDFSDLLSHLAHKFAPVDDLLKTKLSTEAIPG